MTKQLATSCFLAILLAGCDAGTPPENPAEQAVVANTCEGPYPNYWQDPAFTETGMWEGQEISDQPPAGWTGPVFQLSQEYPATLIEDHDSWGWTKFDPFKEGLSAAEKEEQAHDYIWAVMRYIQDGNITDGADGGDVGKDWTLCENQVRNWYHMPYQTYEPLSGREFVHGLTREAPVTFKLDGGKSVATTIWAVGFYNARGGHTLGEVWKPDGTPNVPTDNLSFAEGAVVGKLLFTTATPQDLPFLENVPKWQINMSASDFCKCTPTEGKDCTFQEMSEQCPRTPGEVYLIQFDVAVRDERSPSGWAFGTFVADGEHKAGEKNPWNRISPLGLMWNNDAPPAGEGAINFPPDPRKNGFPHEVIFWDVVDRLNTSSNSGHLGCNGRLNGPADNPRSACMSCHMTASVHDSKLRVPPIFDIDFADASNGQCTDPPNLGPDGVYFADTPCATPFQGGSVVPPPDYASGRKEWISTDFSLQLSISLVQYGQWMQHQKAQAAESDASAPARRLTTVLPAR